jgi:flagellin
MLACNYDTDCHMVINTNPAAARGARFLADATDNLQKSLARLSSGTKIVDPQDDAAGMAVSSRMDAQINRTQATRSNIGNAISLKQTQDGYLSKVGKALDRMSELATLAQDQTKTGTDLSLYNKEYETLYSYIDNIDDQLFNGVSLFQGAAGSAGIKVLIDDAGSSTSSYFTTAGIALSVSVTTSLSAGSSTNLSSVLTTSASAADALETVKSAITQVATFRASIGSDLSRLMSTDSHLSVLSENLSASLSRIKDVDVAEESAKYAKYNILVQSGTAMLAQANSLPQSALRLLS